MWGCCDEQRPTLTQRIERAITEYQDAAQRAQEFRAEYQPMLDRLAQLDEEQQLAKQAIAEVLVEAGIDEGAHNGTIARLVQQDRGRYDVSKLPRTSAVMEACDLAISRAPSRRGQTRDSDADGRAISLGAEPSKPYVSLTSESARRRSDGRGIALY